MRILSPMTWKAVASSFGINRASCTPKSPMILSIGIEPLRSSTGISSSMPSEVTSSVAVIEMPSATIRLTRKVASIRKLPSGRLMWKS
ncbi:hypothetical protein D3C72_747600 [compost metagenome]